MRRQNEIETVLESPEFNENCQEIITSDDYIDVVRELELIGLAEQMEGNGAGCVQILSNQFGVFHIKREDMSCDELYQIQPYQEVPNIFGINGQRAVYSAGISAVFKLPALQLTGNDVIIGIVDTGIDYTHEAFIYEDGTSKILSIWDQTVAGNPPEGFKYGSEYNVDQINEALLAEDPLSVVPEQDEIGHGTFIAGVAAGRENKKENFIGAAPDASLVVVKLKQAKKCLREFYSIKDNAIGFQSNDLILGINYLIKKAKSLNRPIVLLLGLGDNMGPHDGFTFTEKILERYSRVPGVIITVAGGNEANKRHHYEGEYDKDEEFQSLQFNVPEGEKGFYISFWNYTPDKYIISLTSPRGTETGKIPSRHEQKQAITFIAETTEILIEYVTIEARTGDEAIFIRLKNPSPGLWNMNVYGELIVNGRYDLWLPREGFVEPNTTFLSPDPRTTVTTPSTNINTITVGAYNDVTKSLYVASGRGPTRSFEIKPDIVAPGVDVSGPLPKNIYGSMSGTSIATAITAGACALLMEWGFVKGNDPKMDTLTAKSLLIRGATRRPSLIYPNPEWGFGEIDLLNTFKLTE